MAVCGHARKDRTHATGKSNRGPGWKPAKGPMDFDATMRSTKPIEMKFKTDVQVPATMHGQGNQDFTPKLPGHDYRMPNSDINATRRIQKETKTKEALEKSIAEGKIVPTITVPAMIGKDEKEREPRASGFEQAKRLKEHQWFEEPSYERPPLQKDHGATWNHLQSEKVQGEIKGQDRLMRTVRRPEDVGTPDSEAGGKRDALQHDGMEYYPDRDLIDAVQDEPGNDFQVRPVHLPDFYNPPPEGVDPKARMQRIREVIRQRYAGRPGLVNVFRNCTLTKPGYVFPRDLMQVLDQMGIKVSEHECDMLVKATDKDQKGALTFEEFSDLVYGARVNVGGSAHEPQERHVRHVTKTLVEDLISNGQVLGKAFCELDPERLYQVSKQQFANALGTACNHISQQAVDFLWAAQFPGADAKSDLSHKCIDWRSFMSQLAHFAHDHRPPTPCCVQGRKRQYDLLQRTAAITGGTLSDIDLNRPEQNADDEVHIVAGRIVHRHTDLLHHPRDAAILSEPFVEEIRIKAERTERALPKRLPKDRLIRLLKNREQVHQDELVALICKELDQPGMQKELSKQLPLYASGTEHSGLADVMTLDPTSFKAQALALDAQPSDDEHVLGMGKGNDTGPSCLQLVKADIEAYVATQKTNRDHEVDVGQFIENVYRPPDEVKQIHRVNDGLNRQIRGNRPQRERPPAKEARPYNNYWQARYLMELINEAIAQKEASNGGKLKPSKIFKRLDFDNDGYVTLSDLRSACEKYNVPNTSADLHAIMTELDKDDSGSVNIGEFIRNFELYEGSLLDELQKPIKAIYHEGGVERGGPVQEMLDARDAEIMAKMSPPPEAAGAMQRGQSEPPGRPASAGSGSVRAGSMRAGSSRSQLSHAGDSVISEMYAQALRTGKARVTDVIRARTQVWKPHKAELYTTMAPTRYGMTMYPDTRHVTEANVPLSDSYLSEAERFKTTNNVHSIFAVPDHRNPQVEDAMKKHARSEFRVERIRQRQREFAERCEVANEAACQFDELKIARKAMNQLNYERRCHMACG
mmetsp:Transcript_119180/g.222814  ORF Transcript_119180/g.222814 Transcript_119180/m.222814 type:complete len:1036 (+) Transcript_119180:67-3174(+)